MKNEITEVTRRAIIDYLIASKISWSGRLNEDEFLSLLDDFSRKKITLAYWPASQAVPDRMGELIASKNGILVDTKTTFVHDHSGISNKSESSHIIIPYSDDMPESDMIELALNSGIYSRYAIDPHIPATYFNELYKQWIRKSISHEFADEVLVSFDGNRIQGMVTVGQKNERGTIGLIAVNADSRGQRLGEALVYAALHWSVSKGYGASQVVTQGDNAAACRLYEKCGYRVETIEPFYHIWLED